MRTTAGSVLLASAVVVGLGTQGCTGNGSLSADSPSSSSSSPSRNSSSATDSPSDVMTDAADNSSQGSQPSEGPADARCRARERDVAIASAFRLQLAIDDLMQSTNGTSASAAAKVRARAEQARLAVRTQCAQPSPAMRRFLLTAERHSEGSLSHTGLDAVLDAYGGWTRDVGVPRQAGDLRQALRGCRALRRDVRASYRVWWRWADVGRVWWIELTFRNDLARALFATLSGRVRVTGRIVEAAGGRTGPRRTVVLQWGASSLDYAEIPRGFSQQLVAPAAGNYVATGADGGFDVLEVAVSVDVPGTRAWWCHLPVPERV